MIRAKAQVEGVKLRITSADGFTAGMVGAQVELTYKDDVWQGLKKTVTFLCGHEKRTVLQTGELVTVPHEVLRKGRRELYMAVCGCSDDGSLCIPTLYGYLGEVKPSADPSGDPGMDPALPVWAEILNRIGDPEDLTTEEKSNLVAAINEAAGTGGSADLKGYATEDWVREGYQQKGDYLTDENIADVLTQAKNSGLFDGAEGKTPVKGADYFTEADKEAFLADMDAVRYEAQTLTAGQQAQARENIGAAGSGELLSAVDEALDAIPTVSRVVITENGEGTVTMVNTLSDGSVETIVITADASGNPGGLTVNGTAIPLVWNEVGE